MKCNKWNGIYKNFLVTVTKTNATSALSIIMQQLANIHALIP